MADYLASLLAEGIDQYCIEEYQKSIEIYNALIICLNSRSLPKDIRRANATMDGGDVTTEDDYESAENKVILFRAHSRRSEAYLALSKHKNAYTDVTEAFALYPHFDNVDDFATSESGLLLSDIELACDLMNRIYKGILGLDNHVHLCNLSITKAIHMLENPEKIKRFVPGLQGVGDELLENTHDDVSVMTLDTWFSTGSCSTTTIGTKKTTSQRSRLDAIDEETPPGGSPINQQRSATSHQICESAVPQLFTAANSVSPIATSESSASASAITHLKHPRSPLTGVSYITKKISKMIDVLNQTNNYEHTTDYPKTKKFDVDAHASDSSSSSFDSLSSHLSDGVNAIKPSQNPINPTHVVSTALQSKETSNSLLSSQRSSVTSHQIREHDIRHAVAVPAEDMESHLHRAAPNLEAVHEHVEEMCNAAGYEEAINTLKTGYVGDMISTLRNRLNIIDVSSTNMPGRENLDNNDHRAYCLGLPTLPPRRELGRRSFGARFTVDFGLEDGDLD